MSPIRDTWWSNIKLNQSSFSVKVFNTLSMLTFNNVTLQINSFSAYHNPPHLALITYSDHVQAFHFLQKAHAT